MSAREPKYDSSDVGFAFIIVAIIGFILGSTGAIEGAWPLLMPIGSFLLFGGMIGAAAAMIFGK